MRLLNFSLQRSRASRRFGYSHEASHQREASLQGWQLQNDLCNRLDLSRPAWLSVTAG
jgi:hypothetical protein